MRRKKKLDPNQRIIFAYLKSESRRMSPLMVFSGFSWSATQKRLPESVASAYRRLDANQEAEVMNAYVDLIYKENRRSLPQIRNEYEEVNANDKLSSKEKHICYIDLLSELERDYDLDEVFTFNPSVVDLEKTEVRLYRKICSST